MRFATVLCVGAACLLFLSVMVTVSASGEEIRFRIRNEIVHRIDPRIFGQFLERASWGEPGPETFVNRKTGRLPGDIVERLDKMRIPVIRFPGGSDVERIDWIDMIDNAPGRKPARPVTRVGDNTITNFFGYDEYFALRDELGCESILVLNLLDGLTKRRSLDEAARHAAGLVAYCNASVGTKLPEGMPDWPAVRAKNGHRAPIGAEYFQIGNEWRFTLPKVVESRGVQGKLALAEWYLKVLHAYIRAIREVDPDVHLIVDGVIGQGVEKIVLRDPLVRDEVRFVAFHMYAPGSVRVVRNIGVRTDPATLTLDDWWYGCATMPGMYADGVNVGLGPQIEDARDLGYRIVCTEWNWHGRDLELIPEAFSARYLPIARGLGAAGFLHGLMRQGEAIDLATQSMLVGSEWEIAAVRADPTGKTPPYYLPQGLATAFYGRHHGEQLLAVDPPMLRGRAQPYIIGEWTRWPRVTPTVTAYVDLLATADAANIYVHAINRHREHPQNIAVDLDELHIGNAAATHLRLVAREDAGGENAKSPQPCVIVRDEAEVRDGVLRAQAPPRSVSILEIPRADVSVAP